MSTVTKPIDLHRFVASAPCRVHKQLLSIDERLLLSFSKVQLISLIYLQKFAIPIRGSPLSINTVVLLSGLIYLTIRGPLSIDPARLIMFLMFASLCFISQLFSPTFSWSSLGLLVALNWCLVIACPVSPGFQDELAKSFQRLMSVPAFIVLAQRVLISAGVEDFLNMEKILPSAIMLPGYTYSAEFGWGTGIVRPNGFFFLEPSFTSGFLATATILEMLTFGRALWVGIFLGACISTYGATGLVMLVLVATLKLTRSTLRHVFLLPLVPIGICLSWWRSSVLFELFRISELSREESSGYGRIVLPLLSILHLIGSEGSIFSGRGAGSITDQFGSAWPALKLIYEYGLATAVAYGGLVAVSVSRSPYPVLMLVLVLIFQFTGGYLLQPVWIGLVVFFCTLFVPRSGAEEDVVVASNGRTVSSRLSVLVTKLPRR